MAAREGCVIRKGAFPFRMDIISVGENYLRKGILRRR